MNNARSILQRTYSTPLILIAMLLVLVLLTMIVGTGSFTRTIVELFIRVAFVVGLYVFIGNSGVMSFGHASFMCIGAYAAAWFTILPAMKKIALPGLPSIILASKLDFVTSGVIASLFTAVIGLLAGLILMRLSGIAASIATFALLAIVNTVYANWESVTAATSSVVGIPIKTGIWTSFIGAALAIILAYAYSISRSGLALRASRDEPIAAAASAVNIYRERVIAFVLSAFICGMSGVLYAHFLGVVNPDAFYLGITFISLAMLVVGGVRSLSGAVVGTVAISLIIQVLRWFEKGVSVGSGTLKLPNGIQEIIIGIVMILILIYRPRGIMQNREVSWSGQTPQQSPGND
jgi:branched-chain amino acid transport system permease protein